MRGGGILAGGSCTGDVVDGIVWYQGVPMRSDGMSSITDVDLVWVERDG
jgi:hypothetical protein